MYVPDERDEYTTTAMVIDKHGSQISEDDVNTFATLESGVAESYKVPTTTSRVDGCYTLVICFENVENFLIFAILGDHNWQSRVFCCKFLSDVR